MGHILLFEPYRDRVRQLVFALHLPGYGCTVTYQVDEALNWLRANRYLETRFDLLLLNPLPELTLVAPLLRAAQESRVPVVCIDSSDRLVPGEVPDGLLVCQPEDLFQLIERTISVASASAVSGPPDGSPQETADVGASKSRE